MKVTEIINGLAGLTTKELQQVERKLIEIYRNRKQGLVFDDAHDVLTEEEHMAAIGEIWAKLDKAEKLQSKPKK